MANCVQCGRKLPPLFFGKKICEWCVRHEAAQHGEDTEDALQPVMPVPWAGGSASPMIVTQGLFGLNLVVFVAMALFGNAMEPTTRQLVASGANYGPRTLGGEPWRLVTAMFLHGGLFHIFFNMWCLWDLGALCESLLGHATFAAVYLISGIAASLASVWWHPAIPSVGASGAIFGIVGALIASYYLGEFSAPRFAVAGRLRSVLIFAGYSLTFGAMSGRTDNAAHTGGLVTGLIFGALIARFAPQRTLFRRALLILAMAVPVFGLGAWLYQSRSYGIRASRGEDLLDQNKPEEAIAELQAAVRQRPNYVPAHISLAHAYYNQRRYDLAEAELKRILTLEPGNQFARFELGAVYLGQKNTQEAKEMFNQLLAMDKYDASAHEGLGMAYAAEGNYSSAVQEFETTAQLNPESETVYYHLGSSQTHLKNYDKAISAFLKQQNHSDDYDTELGLAIAYRAKGMQAQAEAAMQKAEQLKPGK